MSKALLYVLFTLISAYILSSINYNNFFKKNKIIEAKIFVILLSFIMSYLITNFVTDFIKSSSIL